MTSEVDLPDDVLRGLEDVPVFPLPQAVLFPGALLPLHVFEPRYRAMLARCLETNRAMVVARIANLTDVDARGEPRFARVAGLGVIVGHQALPDGRSNIVLQGRARVSLEERSVDTPYRRARATVLEDVRSSIPSTDRAAILAAATSFTAELQRHAELAFALPAGATADTIADLCAHHLLFDADTRQAVLEERDVALRVRRVTAELAIQQCALERRIGRPLN